MGWNSNVTNSASAFRMQSSGTSESSHAKASTLPVDIGQILNGEAAGLSKNFDHASHEYSIVSENNLFQNGQTLAKTCKFTPNSSFNKPTSSNSRGVDANMIINKPVLLSNAEAIRQSFKTKPPRPEETYSLNTKLRAAKPFSPEDMHDPDSVPVIHRDGYLVFPTGSNLSGPIKIVHADGQEEEVPPEMIIEISKEEFDTYIRDVLEQLLFMNNTPKSEVSEHTAPKDLHQKPHVNTFRENPLEENELTKKLREAKDEKDLQLKAEKKKVAQKSGIRLEAAKKKQIANRRKKENTDQAYLQAQKTKSERAHADRDRGIEKTEP